MKLRVVLWSLAIAVYVLPFACCIWPTPWEYGTVKKESWIKGKDGKHPWVTFPSRTNRWSGEVQIQNSDGEWGPDFVW